VSGATPKVFRKTLEVEHAPRLAAEAEGLAALRDAGAIRVPAFKDSGEDEENAWIELEFLELLPLDETSGALLGEALARQHRAAHEKFGWAKDNFIGASPQANGWSDDWLGFWRAQRLHPQLRMAARNRYPSRTIDRGERLLADCEVFFRHYRPAKSLLHGDLWSGNASRLPDGMPVVFDPAVYVGDREADLAMTELFGGFPKEFHAAYRNAWPMDDGYRVRRDFYNLYHVLNHANIFSGDYVRQAEVAIERLLAEIS
jgi:protein-ribulosamine 3-kinase